VEVRADRSETEAAASARADGVPDVRRRRPDIVHVLPHAYPLGGTERTVLDLLTSDMLSDLDQRVVFLRGGPLGPFPPERVLALSAAVRPKLARAARAVAAARPRIVHGWLLRGNAFGAAVSTLLPGARLLTSERNVGHALTTPTKRLFERVAAAREDVCVVNSAAVAEAAVARIPSRRGRIRIILPGIEEPPDDGPRASYTAVSVGRLEPVKDHATLLRAWRVIVDRRPGSTLALVGDGPERASLERLAESLGLGSSLTLPGACEPAPFLRGATVFLSTSRAEGFSRASLEALACGLPIVSTDVGGVEHLPPLAVQKVPVADATAIADAVDALLVDETLRARASRAAVEGFRRDFRRERCHAAFRELYLSYLR
jgi:glycosyltransferase involved in cell wall biosynthesis